MWFLRPLYSIFQFTQHLEVHAKLLLRSLYSVFKSTIIAPDVFTEQLRINRRFGLSFAKVFPSDVKAVKLHDRVITCKSLCFENTIFD